MNEEKTQFTEKIAEKRAEFDRLYVKFQSLDNPVERYIKRQEMLKVKEFLDLHNVHVEIP